jgi:hypothetical protein
MKLPIPLVDPRLARWTWRWDRAVEQCGGSAGRLIPRAGSVKFRSGGFAEAYWWRSGVSATVNCKEGAGEVRGLWSRTS